MESKLGMLNCFYPVTRVIRDKVAKTQKVPGQAEPDTSWKEI